ncbi:hypothetical protein PC122_g21862 [Phytophthora cactorum]|nr:hypothetical protein PC122_g21862 [Phytophthora cactorum]
MEVKNPHTKEPPSAGPGDKCEGATYHDLVALFGSDDDDEDQPRSAQASSLSATHRHSGVTTPYRSSSDEDDSSADEGPRDPSIAQQPSLPSSTPSTPMEVDDDGGRSRKDAGGDSRKDEPAFDFSCGDTAGEEAVPAPTEGSSPAGGAGDPSSPARSDIPGGEGSTVDTGRPGADEGTLPVPHSSTPLRRTLSPPDFPQRRLPPPGSARSRASSLPQEAGIGRMIVATYTSRLRYGDHSPAQPLPMSHQVVQGPRPAVLPSASFPPWVQPYLDTPFTAPGPKRCFERVLSKVLPDPTPGGVVIHVTIESLRAFFDYEDPNHPWQIMRQLLPDEPCLFGIAGFDPKAHVSKRAPYETRIKVLWANFRGAGPKPYLGFALWEQCHWILAGAVEKGFTREASDPNHDRALLKSKVALWRLLLSERNNRADRLRNMYQDQYMKWCLESVTAPRRSFIHPELIAEPSVPSYPVKPLPFIPKNTDWLAEAAAWVFAPYDHPFNTTYVPCHHDAPIFSSRTADPITIGRAIITEPSLTSALVFPDWQRRFFSAPGSPRHPASAASAGGGNDGSSASGAPPVAHASPPDEEEKDSGGPSSLGLLADAADRMTSS